MALFAVADEGDELPRFPRARPEPRPLPKVGAGGATFSLAAIDGAADGALTVSAGATVASPDVSDSDMTCVVVLFDALTEYMKRERRVSVEPERNGSRSTAQCQNIHGEPDFRNLYLGSAGIGPPNRSFVSPSLPRRGDRRSHELMDKLEEIFRMQATLNSRIGVNLPPASDEEKAKWILNYTRALQQETAELIDSVPWKWWAKYQKFDEQNAKVEVVDLFHFLVSLAQTLGMTAEDVYQAYVKKNQVNHARQESGYVKKDETDSRHI